MIKIRFIYSTVILILAVSLPVFGQGEKLTFEDVMKFEDISDPVISDNGGWLAYGVWPDRGDGEVRVRSTDGNKFYTIERGEDPSISSDEQWVAAFVQPPFAETLAEENDAPKQGMALLNTSSGEITNKERVRSFTLSNNGKWIAYRHHQAEDVEEKKSDNRYLGTEMILKNLGSGAEYSYPFVSSLAFDSTSSYLAFSVVDTSGESNGLYMVDLRDEPVEADTVASENNAYYSNLSWDDSNRRVAFTEAAFSEEDKPGEASIYVWEAGNGERILLLDADEAGGEWALRSRNNLEWTHDGERLFFGLQWKEFVESEENAGPETDTADTVKVYDRDTILEDKGVDVWHWDDPRIKTHEKETWDRRKNHLYRAVYHMDSNEWVRLADRDMPDLRFTENPDYALGSSSVPYLKLMTWEGFFSDYYVVNINTGERQKVADKLRFGANISPGGRYVVFYRDKQWHLYDVEEQDYRNLTEGLEVPFYNEDHDYPYPVPGYGVAGWTQNDRSVLIYDKYDIWQFAAGSGDSFRITEGEGRASERIFRIERMDRDKRYFEDGEELLLQSYHDKRKNYGFYTAEIGNQGVQRRLEEEKNFDLVAKAEDSDRMLYTRQSYAEYPNLWIADGKHFDSRERISGLHLDLSEKYAWGTAELVEWNSLDGKPLQGVLIKPGDYQEGKQYPVLIYYYRFFSQRLHDFNEPRTNHRPVFAQYASDGYAVFLPDIRFEVGTPGFAATKSLVPGVQKLIEMGIADPDGLGLHGHSWSGYQTAFMITQTDIFDAAVAGAPVSNMTSAYSGIRWGSGLARQFQYEETQSRIGGSLWQYPERYIENSPVFYADRIETPLLIQFGDEDGAVPWYQGIELYLAMRRLGKDALFLQYHGEPHHLQDYSNKLDYAIKMKEYFDHYLKGTSAPEWISDGVPYRGGN